MTTTQQLIELQRSITQGEWKWVGTKLHPKTRVYLSSDAGSYAAWQSLTDMEESANATAIALVPELLAEVIRLREALSALHDLASDYATAMRPKLTEACESARAALAGEK